MTPLFRNLPWPPPRTRPSCPTAVVRPAWMPTVLPTALPATLLLGPLLVLFAACAPGSDGGQVARGLVPLDTEEFVPPEHRDHELEGGEREGHVLEREGFHDFGDVPFGETAKHTFRLANTDPVPITIQRLDASCSCSIPRVFYMDPESGERVNGVPSRSGNILTVPAGVEVQLEVGIDTRNVRLKNLDKLVSLRVTTDSLNQPFTTLEMHMVVTRDFALFPADFLDLGLVPVGSGKAGSVQLTPDGGSGAVLTEVVGTSDEQLVAALDYEFGQQAAVWRLDAALAAGTDLGAYNGWVRMATRMPDGSDGAVLEVRVAARVVEDVHVPQGRLILTGDPLSAWADVQAVGADMRLSQAGVELRGAGSAQLLARVEPREPDDDGASRTWRVVLTVREGAKLPPGSLSGFATVHFGAPIEVVKEIPYVHVPR